MTESGQSPAYKVLPGMDMCCALLEVPHQDMDQTKLRVFVYGSGFFFFRTIYKSNFHSSLHKHVEVFTLGPSDAINSFRNESI